MKFLLEDKYVHGRDPFAPPVKVNLKHIGKSSNFQRGGFKQRAHIVESHFAREGNPTLVIHQLLTTNEKEEEWKQTMIFRMRVKCEDMLANLVIDNDITINFVAQVVIDKPHWPIKKLAKPYKVIWSNGSLILATHKCLVSFTLGGYEDEIWCDVIPTNITHILLVRPWLLDLKVQHDKEKNIYSLSWKGRWVSLIPMQPTKSPATPSPSTEEPKEEQKREIEFAGIVKQHQ